jgi:heme o synthase
LKKKQSDLPAVVTEYYRLTKPGIIRGNSIVTAAGFLLASQGRIDWLLFVVLLLGTSLVIASACVFNNILDRDIDPYMARTKKRATVTGAISALRAGIFASMLGVLGLFFLGMYVNKLTALIGATGLIMYVIVYGIAKRRTVHGTLVGSISGAMPPVAGYTAVTNSLDVTAGLLFLILVFWQMPHFFAIGIYRLQDYRAAKLPIVPVVRSMRYTKIQMLLYAVGFAVSALLLSIVGATGITYLLLMSIVSIYWLYVIGRGLTSNATDVWARKVFGSSLIVLLAWSVLLAINSLLP